MSSRGAARSSAAQPVVSRPSRTWLFAIRARGEAMSRIEFGQIAIQIAGSLLVAIVTSVLTAALTVWLALRRFYREKWWEAKQRAYSDIIQALHHIKRDLEISIDAEIDGRDTNTDFYKGSDAKHRTAWDDLRKFADVGEFLFSSDSVQILEVALNADSPEDVSPLDRMETLQAAAVKCLTEIKAAARKDLKLPARVD
jgi:hypothetical protein